LKCDLPFGSGIKRSKDSGSIYPFDEAEELAPTKRYNLR